MFRMNWWLFPLLTLLGILCVIITCYTKARYSLRVENKMFRAPAYPDNVDCDIDASGVKAWNGVTFGHVAIALSCVALYPTQTLLGWQSPCWYPLMLNGLSFVSAYFVDGIWKAQEQMSQLKALHPKHLISDLPSCSVRC